ncbi:MAG: TraB/GumN family protein [Prevotella sp.]
MKKIMMIALLMAVAITGAKAQLLYKISGKDLKQPSYIVGTYHLAPVSFVDSIPGLRTAMTETQQVCGELDMSDMMSPDNIQKMMKAMMLPEGKTLKDYLSAEEMDKLNQLMKNLIGMDLTNPILEQQMGKMTPSAISTQLAVLMYMKHTPGFDPTNLFDGYFQKAAKEANKPVVGLETMDFQMKTLYQSRTLERQKTMLMCMVNNTAYHEQNLIALTRAFFAKDLAKMWEITKEKENNSCDSTPEEDAQLIDNRNIDWLTKLPAIMADKSTLIAVGAGHLPGDKGVLSLLRKAGYTVEAVK